MAGKNISQNGEIYMTGTLNINVLGQEVTAPVFILKNDRRQKGTQQPHMRIYTKQGDQLVEVGALWLKRKNGNGNKKTKSSQ